MGVNQVIYGGETVMDISDSTVTEDTLLQGAAAYNAAGERIVGAVVTVPVDAAPTEGSSNAVSSGGVYEALQGLGGGVSRVTATLTTGGWSAGSGYAYTQTVSLAGVTAETDFDVDVDLSGTDAEADALILAAFGLVIFADSVSGGIKFACATEKPEVNIPLIIRIYA